MTIQHVARVAYSMLACALLCLAGCGSVSKLSSSPALATRSQSTDATLAGRYGRVAVPLRPDDVTGDTNPEAKFQGCWYKEGKKYYQGVYVTVTNPGEYTFNANLYYGTTCDPDTQADEFGYGQEIDFNDFGYIFWFTAFDNKPDMSAIWQVGSDTSKCMNYKTAPMCQ
jgi:hypothetical protein